jgi:hypothetical protein
MSLLIVVSPAKTLDYESPLATKRATQPYFLNEAEVLMGQLRELTPDKLGRLMSISDKLAQTNWQRNQEWSTPFDKDNARACVLAFKGDVYTGLDAETFSNDDFSFAQKHFRILSGLYGLLKPLDLMQPYRLEMGTKFANNAGKNLYEFWGEKITDKLNQELKSMEQGALINLASNEYFKVVKPKLIESEIITPVFKDWKNGDYKVISFLAKKARGMMSRYIIQNKIDDVTDIKSFDLGGYRYDKKSSSENEFVFLRKVK